MIKRSLTLLTILGLLAVAAVSMPATSAAGSSPAFALPTILRDRSGNSSLAVQLALDRPDTGKFNFFVTGLGDYSGVIPVTQVDRGIELLKGNVETQFHPATGGPASSAKVTMEGEVNTNHQTASVNLLIDGAHYLLVTITGLKGDASVAANRALTAIRTHDWQTLYTLLVSRLKVDLTQTQFAQIMASQDTPQILSADLSGTGQVTLSLGFTYFTQPITVQAQKSDGTAINFSSTIYLVLEQGEWRLLSTDPPPSP